MEEGSPNDIYLEPEKDSELLEQMRDNSIEQNELLYLISERQALQTVIQLVIFIIGLVYLAHKW